VKPEARELVTTAESVRRALAAQRGGAPLALVMLVGAPDPEVVGRRLVVSTDSVTGTLGAAALDERAVELARAALASDERGLHDIEEGGERFEVYVEPQRARPELLIVGAGHIARPLCRIGALIGFNVTVIDDRPEYANRDWFPEASRVQVVGFDEPFKDVTVGPDSYVVLVTRGHKYDYDCIQQLLALDARPAYLGMIGSRRRVRAAFEALVRDGIDPARLESVHAPIGLDIGAERPEEIALSIAAELVATRRGGAGGRLSHHENVLGRVAREPGGA
jgi:xanthine dehydrogenase accessory factor